MNYYAIKRKKDVGCPVGYISWVLFDKFYSQTAREAVRYGEFPWYAESREAKIPPFPSSICLVYDDGRLDFDIRAEAGCYFIVLSELACEALLKANVVFDDIRPVLTVNSGGESISDIQYFVARLSPLLAADVDSGESIFDCNSNGRPVKIKKLSIVDGFKLPIFRIKGMQGASQTLICSEEVRSKLESVGACRGIDFVPVSNEKLEPYWNFEAV